MVSRWMWKIKSKTIHQKWRKGYYLKFLRNYAINYNSIESKQLFQIFNEIFDVFIGALQM